MRWKTHLLFNMCTLYFPQKVRRTHQLKCQQHECPVNPTRPLYRWTGLECTVISQVSTIHVCASRNVMHECIPADIINFFIHSRLDLEMNHNLGQLFPMTENPYWNLHLVIFIKLDIIRKKPPNAVETSSYGVWWMGRKTFAYLDSKTALSMNGAE